MAQQVINPATGERGATFALHFAIEVDEFLVAAEQGFLVWRKTSFDVRAQVLRRAAALLEERQDQLARLMTHEMGKPLSQARAEVTKCARVCTYYAEHGAAFLAPETIATEARRSFVAFEPLGVVLAVMPWNFPLWQVFRFAAPSLMAGNAGVLKHASNVPGCAQAIERIWHDAGLPPTVFRALFIDVETVASVIEHRSIRAVTLTGSTPAGRAVAATAGRALKKTVLELGGSDAYVILADADLDVAAQACVEGRLLNSGQSCIAAKRWIVVDSVREDFEAKVLERMRDQVVGDPLVDGTDVGPLARVDLRDALHQQVETSIESGARLLLGGQIPDRVGAWYPVTLLTDVGPGMPAYDDELFGPVGAILPVADEAEALRVANDTVFGLGAAVFTRDLERGERIAAHELEAGACFVNAAVHSDPRLPFGGIKQSGYGRELSRLGIREFVNAKTVYVAPD